MKKNKTKINVGDHIISIAICLAITLGVNLQVGNNSYSSNIVMKIFGVLLPVTFALVVLLLKNKNLEFGLDKKKSFWLVALLIYIFFLATTSSEIGRFMLGTADRNLGGISIGLAVLCFFVGRLLSKNQQKFILIVLILNGVCQALVVGYQKYLQPDILSLTGIGVFEAPPVYGTFYNSNPLSFFLGIVASGLSAFLLRSKIMSKVVLLACISLSALFLGLAWSGSSQGLIAVLITGLFYIVSKYIRPIKQKFSLVLSLTYGFGLITFFLVVTLLPLQTSSNISGNPYLERLEIYKSALQISAANFVTGAGTDRFASEYGKYTLLSDLKLVDNAHSIPLHILSTQGLFGLFFFLSFMFWVLSTKENSLNSQNSEWSFWQAVFFSYALIGIIGIDHPAVTAVGFLAAGILRSKHQDSKITIPKSTLSFSPKLVYSVTLFFGIFLSFTLFCLAHAEIKVGNSISQLSQKTISISEF